MTTVARVVRHNISWLIVGPIVFGFLMSGLSTLFPHPDAMGVLVAAIWNVTRVAFGFSILLILAAGFILISGVGTFSMPASYSRPIEPPKQPALPLAVAGSNGGRGNGTAAHRKTGGPR